MLIPIRTKDGKLLFKWDKDAKVIEIVRKEKASRVFLLEDGTYQVNDVPKQSIVQS